MTVDFVVHRFVPLVYLFQIAFLIFDLFITLYEFFVEGIDLFSVRTVLRVVIGLAVRN